MDSFVSLFQMIYGWKTKILYDRVVLNILVGVGVEIYLEDLSVKNKNRSVGRIGEDQIMELLVLII